MHILLRLITSYVIYWFPSNLSMPMEASGTLYEATVPVKLPGSQFSLIRVKPEYLNPKVFHCRNICYLIDILTRAITTYSKAA